MQTKSVYQEERKDVDDTVITDFQVKPSTMKSKPTMTFTDVSTIKNLERLKCQEIVSFQPQALSRE